MKHIYTCVPLASETQYITMKKDIHPQYNPVVFVDITTGRRFITRSTVRSPKTEVIDGVEHFVVSCGITSDSHPFFTGKNQFVDTEGRIDKFRSASAPSAAAEASPSSTSKNCLQQFSNPVSFPENGVFIYRLPLISFS